MDIEQHERNGVVILGVVGRIELDADNSKLKDMVSDLIDSGKKKLVVNLKKSGYVDHVALGALVSILSKLTRSKGGLRLCELNHSSRQLIGITKLDEVFQIYETENEAFQSFAK